MRLDLFLKTSRLVKRRTFAQDMCDAGKVLVNGLPAKPAKDVKAGDVITLTFSSRIIELDVLRLPMSTTKTSIEDVYAVKSETKARKENDSWNENPS